MRMRREWDAEGKPEHRVPIIWSRPSRLIPRGINHWLVAWISDTDTLHDIRSYTPDDHSPLRWWKLWKIVDFHGTVKHGDSPDE